MLNNTQASLEQFAQTLAAIVRGEISVEGWTPETARVALANLQNQSLAPVSPPPQQTGGMTTDELAAYINSYNVNPRKVSQSVRGATRGADPVIGVDERGERVGGYTSFSDEIDSVGGRYGTYQEANKDMRSRVGSSLIADKYGKDVPEDVGRDPGAYIYNEAGTKQVRNPVKGVLRIQPLDKVQRLADELAVNTGMKGGSLPYGVNSAYAPEQSAISLLDAYNQGLISTEDLIQGRSIDTGLTEKQAGYDEAIKAMQELDMGAIPAANRAANEALLSNLGFLRYEPRARERLGTEFIPVTKGAGLPTAVKVDSFNRAVQQDAGASAAIADVLQGRRLGSQMPLSQIQNVMADVNALDNTVPYNTDDAADQANQRGDVFDQAARQVNTDAIKGRLNRNDYDIDAGYLDNNAEKLNLIGKRQQQIKGRIEEVLQGLGANSLAEARQTIANNPDSQGVGQYLEGLVSEYVGYAQDAKQVGDPQDMQGMRRSVRVTDKRLLGEQADAAEKLSIVREKINQALPPELMREGKDGWTYKELSDYISPELLRAYQSAQQELDRANYAITTIEDVDNAAFNQRVSEGGRVGFYEEGDAKNATGMQVADQLLALRQGTGAAAITEKRLAPGLPVVATNPDDVGKYTSDGRRLVSPEDYQWSLQQQKDRAYRMANPRQLMVEEAKGTGNLLREVPVQMTELQYNNNFNKARVQEQKVKQRLKRMVGNDYSVTLPPDEIERLKRIENEILGLEQLKNTLGLTPEQQESLDYWDAERFNIINSVTKQVEPSRTVQPSAIARRTGNLPNSELTFNPDAYLAVNPNASTIDMLSFNKPDEQGVVSTVDQTITDTPIKVNYRFPSMDRMESDPPVYVTDADGKLIRVEGNKDFEWTNVDSPAGSLYDREISPQQRAKALEGGNQYSVSNKYAREPQVTESGLWGQERFVDEFAPQTGLPVYLEEPDLIYDPDNTIIGTESMPLHKADYVNGELNQNIFDYLDNLRSQITQTDIALKDYEPLLNEQSRLIQEIDLLSQGKLSNRSGLTAQKGISLGDRFAQQGFRPRSQETAQTLDGTALRIKGMDSRLGLINAKLSDPAIGGSTRGNLMQQRDQLLKDVLALQSGNEVSGDYITQTELPSGEPVINNSLDTESAIAIRQAQLDALYPKLEKANILKARKKAMREQLTGIVTQLSDRSLATGLQQGQANLTNALRYQKVGDAINQRRSAVIPAIGNVDSLASKQYLEGERAREALIKADKNRGDISTERPAKPGDNSLDNRAIEYVQAEDAANREWEQLLSQGRVVPVKEYDDMIAANTAQLNDAIAGNRNPGIINRLKGNQVRLMKERQMLADKLGYEYKTRARGRMLNPIEAPQEIRAELSPKYRQFVDDRLAASGGRTGVTTVIPGTTYEQQPLPTGINTRTQELIDTTYYAPGEGEEDRVMSESYGQTRPITKADTISSLEAARASAVEDYGNLKGVNKVVSKTPILKKKVVAPPPAPPASVTPERIVVDDGAKNKVRRWISAASRPGLTESLVSRVPVTALTQAAREADVIAPERIPVASFSATGGGVEPPPSVRIPVEEALPEPPSLVSPTVAVNAPSPVVEEALNTAEEVAKRPWLARNKWLVGGAGLAAATAIGAALNQRRKEEERQRMMMMSRF